MMNNCKVCGFEYHSVHVTYDDFELPYITKKCGKYVEKCQDLNFMMRNLHGGHNFIRNVSRSDKWRNEGSDDE